MRRKKFWPKNIKSRPSRRMTKMVYDVYKPQDRRGVEDALDDPDLPLCEDTIDMFRNLEGVSDDDDIGD